MLWISRSDQSSSIVKVCQSQATACNQQGHGMPWSTLAANHRDRLCTIKSGTSSWVKALAFQVNPVGMQGCFTSCENTAWGVQILGSYSRSGGPMCWIWLRGTTTLCTHHFQPPLINYNQHKSCKNSWSERLPDSTSVQLLRNPEPLQREPRTGPRHHGHHVIIYTSTIWLIATVIPIDGSDSLVMTTLWLHDLQLNMGLSKVVVVPLNQSMIALSMGN